MKYVILLLVILLAATGYAADTINIYNCSDFDAAGTTYVLKQDIVNTGDDICMNVSAENIVLDCEGHLIDGVDAQESYGLIIVWYPGTFTNATIRNCRINDWDNGAWIFDAHNISLVNVDISSSMQYGLFSYEGEGNIYRNVSVSGSHTRGFVLWNTSNNLVENCNSSDNEVDGFLIDSGRAHNNTIRNSQATNNKENGFFIYYTLDNTIYNVTSRNNSIGVLVYYSDGNNVSHSRFIENNVTGIELAASGSTERNYVYDNLFNNTIDYTIYGEFYPNHWNISQQYGDNILGGEYLGGNYWATPEGGGFSEEHNDLDQNGYCDAVHELSEEDYDYLSLSRNAYNCALEGNNAPCSQVSLGEVIALVNKWVTEEATLGEVVNLVEAWIS